MTSPTVIDQLVVVVVSGSQAGELMQRLTQNKYYFTKIDSSGGVLREPTVCLLVGLNHTRRGLLLQIVRRYCKPYRQYIPAAMQPQPGPVPPPMVEAQLGGATVYVMNVERFEQL